MNDYPEFRGLEQEGAKGHHDPEAAARHHLRYAETHTDLADTHEGAAGGEEAARFQRRDDEYMAGEHRKSASLHLAAAHALSPGLKARAASQKALDHTDMTGFASTVQLETEANRRSEQAIAGPFPASGKAPSLKSRVNNHLKAADAHDKLENAVPGSSSRERRDAHAEAAHLHREAAAHYSALEDL